MIRRVTLILLTVFLLGPGRLKFSSRIEFWNNMPRSQYYPIYGNFGSEQKLLREVLNPLLTALLGVCMRRKYENQRGNEYKIPQVHNQNLSNGNFRMPFKYYYCINRL